MITERVMQTIDFIQTVKWISSLYQAAYQKFFAPDSRIGLTKSQTKEELKKVNPFAALMTHDMYRVAPSLRDHPFAPIILKEFNLEALMSEEEIIGLSNVYIHGTPEREAEKQILV